MSAVGEVSCVGASVGPIAIREWSEWMVLGLVLGLLEDNSRCRDHIMALYNCSNQRVVEGVLVVKGLARFRYSRLGEEVVKDIGDLDEVARLFGKHRVQRLGQGVIEGQVLC